METNPKINLLNSVNSFIELMKNAGFNADVEIDDKGLVTILIPSDPNYQIPNNTKPTNHEDFFDIDILLRNTEELYQSQINDLSPMQNNVLDDGNTGIL